MKKVLYLLAVVTLFVNITQAQEKIDFNNIFNTQYTSIGVPAGGQVIIYSRNDTNWLPADSLKTPENYIAIDGNIRRVLFLFRDQVIIKQNDNCGDLCRTDTLRFDQKFEKVAAANWLRNIASTESEYGYLKNETNVAVYRDGEEWFISDKLNPQIFKENKTVPLLTSRMPHDKIYLYNHSLYLMTVNKKKVRFYKYESSIPEVNAQAINPEQLNIDLPGDAITAFVYDDVKLGWVYKDRIEFFEFDKSSSHWEKSARVETLYFRAM